MAQTGFVTDDELANSLRVIQKDRSRKRTFVLGAMVAAVVVAGFAVYAAYSSTPDAAKIPAAGPNPQQTVDQYRH